jgi:CheY-like chemotaxis protein
VISVSDTGIGMDREMCSRIFEPFFTTKPQGVGTGLGLSVVHGIMKSHSGVITVYSEPGKGSVFNLYFPASTGKEEPEALASENEPRQSGNGHVLYVDDEEALVFLAKRILELDGYVVSGFTDPEEALTKFNADPEAFDMLITDMSMPRLPGPELAERVLSTRPEIPVVMFTGYISAEDSEIANRIGVKEIVQKPNSIDRLSDIVSRFID